MKSAKSSLTNLCKAIGFHSANMVEALSTCICSIAAFGSLFVLDGWMKMVGFVGFLVLAFLVAWVMDIVKGEA